MSDGGSRCGGSGNGSSGVGSPRSCSLPLRFLFIPIVLSLRSQRDAGFLSAETRGRKGPSRWTYDRSNLDPRFQLMQHEFFEGKSSRSRMICFLLHDSFCYKPILGHAESFGTVLFLHPMCVDNANVAKKISCHVLNDAQSMDGRVEVIPLDQRRP